MSAVVCGSLMSIELVRSGRLLRAMAAFLLISGGALVNICSAQEQKRVALVVANADYKNAPMLPNPTNDGTDMAAALHRLGFSVQLVTDATHERMRQAFRGFGSVARNAEVAIIYFAGHGIEAGGENWLLPVDAELEFETTVDQEAISLRSMLPLVSGTSKLGLIILDSCRTNPFLTSMKRIEPTRAVNRGLARIEPSGNVLVAYTAKDGTVAADGSGRNSPFTAALLKYIETPGLEVGFLFRNVRDAVILATARRQEPYVYGTLSTDLIYLSTPASPSKLGQPPGTPVIAPPPAASPHFQAAERAWVEVRNSTSLSAINAFIKRFGDTFYGDLARERLKDLKTASRPSTSPAPPAQRVPSRRAARDCSALLLDCQAVCVRNTGRPNCPQAGCPKLYQSCLATGCWRGKLVNECGVARR